MVSSVERVGSDSEGMMGFFRVCFLRWVKEWIEVGVGNGQGNR